MLDVVIRGGVVVDGTGSEGRVADVGVRDGRVVTVGGSGEAARRVIDAEGCVVTPGFIDLHTHYDGQVSWDPVMAPSVVHGVTTCVMGNCGVGFAPVRERDRAGLVSLMEGVEDIPGSALAEGIDWRWESFAEYLDALDAKPRTIDVLGQVPHDALRVYVMGERAMAREAATEDDARAMAAALREAVLAGAAGFSTGRTDNHRAATGEPTPSSEADARELRALGAALKGLGHGVLQAVSDFDMAAGPERFDAEFDVLEAMAEASGGRPLSISLMQRDAEPDQWEWILKRAEKAHARGLPTRVQVAPRAIGVMLGLGTTFHPFMGFPTYKRLSHLPMDERVRALRDPAVKSRILSEKSEPVAGDGSALPPLADHLLARIDMVALRLFRLGERPEYEPRVEQSLYAEAQATGRSALEVIYDAMLADDGQELLYFPLFNYTLFNLDNVRAMMAHPLSLMGLSDGGAHVGTVCDASNSTFLLTHWARDRAEGRMTLGEAVRRLTQEPARYLGLGDRGVIAAGMRADLNVIDHAGLSLRRPRLVQDLPAGGSRLMQDASGYRATLVAGRAVVESDQPTDERPGRVVRAGR